MGTNDFGKNYSGPLRDAAVLPIATLDPTAKLDDLAPLARLIGDEVRVVAIGESAHGAHEYYALRHRLIRLLVERLGFTAVAWESGFPEGFAVDGYIQGQRDDRDRVLIDGMTMHMGRCQEMADLVDWLRRHNESKQSASDRVRFYGLDLPGTGATARPALDVVAAYIQSVDEGFGQRLSRLVELGSWFKPEVKPGDSEKLLLEGTQSVHQYVAIAAEDRNELTALLADCAARFDAMRRSYVERSDAERYEVARQHLRYTVELDLQLRAVASLIAGDAAACQANIRDRAMADTVEWLLTRHRRVVVAAHNGHIQRTPISTVEPHPPVDTLGVHLADRLGEQYLTIGTTCGGGEIIVPRTSVVDGQQQTELTIGNLPPAEEGSLDRLLDDRTSGMGLLDLRTLDASGAAAIDAAGRMLVQNQYVKVDARRSFDMLIHVPRISLWTSSANASLPDERGG